MRKIFVLASAVIVLLFESCTGKSTKEKCDFYLIYEGAYAKNEAKVPEIYGIDVDVKTEDEQQMVLKYANGKKEVLEIDFSFMNGAASKNSDKINDEFLKAIQKFPDDALIVMLKNGNICWFELDATGTFYYSTNDNLFVYTLNYAKMMEKMKSEK